MAKKRRRKTRQEIIAGYASRKGIGSEDNFVKRLKRRGFTAYKTGKAVGIPDIVAWKNQRLQFFEIKPGFTKSKSKALLMKTQAKWIKNYCMKTRVKVTLVYYKGSRPFRYHEIPLKNSKDISDYAVGTKKDILEETKKMSYR